MTSAVSSQLAYLPRAWTAWNNSYNLNTGAGSLRPSTFGSLRPDRRLDPPPPPHQHHHHIIIMMAFMMIIITNTIIMVIMAMIIIITILIWIIMKCIIKFIMKSS